MRNLYDAVIIGAGAAGLMAAATAAERNLKVLVLEKTDSCGNKISISGGHRCNLTNTEEMPAFLDNFSPSGVFLTNAFSRFFNDDLISFFHLHGVTTVKERGGRVYVASGKASDVTKMFLRIIDRDNVTLLKGKRVVSVTKSQGLFKTLTADGDEFLSGNVLISTGGSSYPGTGSAGDGYALAKAFGHTVIAPRPGLMPINFDVPPPRSWKDMLLKNVKCSLLFSEKTVTSRFGEMWFTEKGASGPIILDMADEIYDLLERKDDGAVYISVNFKPALSPKQVDNRLLREFSKYGNSTLEQVFKTLLPGSMVQDFLSLSGITKDTAVHSVKKETRRCMVRALTDTRFRVVSTASFSDAIITRGGISVKEIDPVSMMSRIEEGLFFAGEVIDVDAKTGGYNFQAAFSTGRQAGTCFRKGDV